MTSYRPLVAITLGDPAGIGPEIVLKTLLAGDVYRDCRPLVVGERRILARASAWVGAAFLDQLRSPAGRSTAAGDWWRFQRAPGRVRAVWSWRDPRPGLGLLALLGRGALGRHRRDGAG